MTTLNRISAASLVAAASLFFSPAAWSLGLGDITVESFLNQPLQVKIDLVTRESDDLGSVTAKLASADDYELIGASREAIPVPIRFLIEDIEGDAYILATSKLSISNPIVRLIVEVNWSSGRLLREYTVFLDPPTIPEQAPIPRVDLRKAPPPVVETATEPAPVPASEQTTESKQAPAADSAPRQPVDGEYGPVSNGETLWGIALNWSRGTGLDPNKVMIAIQRENPGAFLRGNINLLKRGAILRMPRADEVNAISMATAISEVTEQTEEFRGRKAAEPVASPYTPLLAAEAAPLEVVAEPEEAQADEIDAVEIDVVETDAIEADAVETDVVADVDLALEQPEVQDQLELVPPSEESDLDSAPGFEETEDGNADASVSVSTLRQDLARSEEDLITQQQENEYLAERIKELETQLLAAEENKVTDANLANMEARLREERLAAAASARQADDTPWYSRLSGWLIGLLVLVVAVVAWLLKRRKDGAEFDLGAEEDQLREIKGEAEEVLRVLEDSEDDATGDDDAESSGDDAEDKHVVQEFGATGDEAELLDEESSDPEIQLDLARAYISMGDKEAARVILDEVESNGSDEQREEAKKMLELLAH